MLKTSQGLEGLCIVCTPLFYWGEEPPNKFLKSGVGEQDLNFYRWVACKEGVDFFRGSCSLYIKNKLKSEIFNGKKKFINKNIFLCHN